VSEQVSEKKSLMYWLNKLEDHFLVFGFVVIIAVGFIQVIMRTVFNNSLTWSEELIRYVYIWLCWVGISLTERRGEHIQLTFIVDFLPKLIQNILAICVSVLLIVFTAWLTWLGFGVVQAVLATSSTSTALKIPLYFVYAAFPVGCFLYCLRIVGRLIKQVKNLVKGDEC